jgi:hypothetical protein
MRPRRVLKPASTAALAGWVALALTIAGGGAPEAQAGTLYRCVGPDGISHYGSRRPSGMTCTVAATYRPDPRPAIAPRPAPNPAASGATPAPAATPARRVEFLASPGAAPAPEAGSTRGARVTRGAVYTYM